MMLFKIQVNISFMTSNGFNRWCFKLLILKKGIIIAQYLQRVSSNLDLGTEMIFQYGKSVPNGRMAFYSLGWRYFGKQWQCSGALNPMGSLHLFYHHQSTSPIQFGVEFESNLRTMESQTTFSYQVDLNKANVTFKGEHILKLFHQDLFYFMRILWF